MLEFKTAPWPTVLKVVSLLGTVLVGGVTIAAIRAIPPVGGFTQRFGTGVACIPPAIIIFSLLFVVRSYRIDGGHLAISRLLWETTVPILGIHEAYHDPAAIKGALRIWGNGGLFGITGLYWNKGLGRFRLFATDPRMAVVLKLHNRTIVISPEDPAGFLRELRHRFPRLVQSTEKTTPPAQ